jgi:uncharacterized membrane protein YgcG
MRENMGVKTLSRLVVATLAFAAVSLAGQLPASAGVNDFSFSSMRVVYLLGINDQGHSTLTTHETLVANFPQTDQNRGIVRAIPTTYRGHLTQVRVSSVRDGNGNDLSYTSTNADGFLTLTVAGSTYLHGENTFEITYEQQDVILDTATGQEFYWDVNGTGWAQPFGLVEASVMLAPSLDAALTGESSCYQGPTGSTQKCASMRQDHLGSTTVFTARATNLSARENLTLAVGFDAGTFNTTLPSFWDSALAMPLCLLAALVLLLTVAMIVLRYTRWRSARSRDAVVAQYEAEDGMTPLIAAQLVGKLSRGIPATIIDLAVRGNLRVIDDEPERRLTTGSKSRYATDFSVEFENETALTEDERAIVLALFEDSLRPGATRSMRVSSTKLYRSLAKVSSRQNKAVIERGLRRQVAAWERFLVPIVSLVASFIAMSLAVLIANGPAQDGLGVLIAILLLPLTGVSWIIATTVRPLTAEGAQAVNRLEGLRLFIQLAEADRLRVLQSPQGAVRASIQPGDSAAVVALSERLLPYAMVFGLEKEWAQSLASLYESAGYYPVWCVGPNAADALWLRGFVTGFVIGANGAWSGSASSSGFGGAAGGGFSGGGGGGGGGGGA